MRKSKKLVAVAIVSMMITRPAWAIFGVGDVVFDPAAVGQMVQQYQQLQQQYQQLKQQYEAVTGTTNYLQGLKKSDIVSGSWQDVVSSQGKGGTWNNAKAVYDKLLTVMNGKQLDSLMDSQQFKHNYQSVRMGMAFSEASYNALEVHIQNRDNLKSKINTTQTIKEAQDLANAIAIEQAQISTITARLSAVQTNLASDTGSKGVTSNQSYSGWLGN